MAELLWPSNVGMNNHATFLVLASSGLLLFGCKKSSQAEAAVSDDLYRVCWQDSAVLRGLSRYIKAHQLTPQNSCLTLASMPVRGGKLRWSS